MSEEPIVNPKPEQIDEYVATLAGMREATAGTHPESETLCLRVVLTKAFHDGCRAMRKR